MAFEHHQGELAPGLIVEPHHVLLSTVSVGFEQLQKVPQKHADDKLFAECRDGGKLKGVAQSLKRLRFSTSQLLV